MMRSTWIVVLFLSLACIRAMYANQIPVPPVEAHLSVSNPTPYEKETFTITLEIISRDIDISSRLDLANLPDRETMQMIGSFEALTVQRERKDDQEITRRRYRAKARAMEPTQISLHPVLRLTSRRRIRSFFGSTVEERPISLQVPEVKIDVQPLPAPPENFSGVIGDFSIEIVADPLEIQAGDLVTIKTTLRGQGWIPEDTLPAIKASPGLRAYRMRPSTEQESSNVRVFSQTVVPMDETVQELPAIPFIWFNTEKRDYQRDTFGPFPLQYISEKPATLADAEDVLDKQDLVRQRGMRRRRIQLSDATHAYLAPAYTSKSTFTIPPTARVRILETHEGWLLADYEGNRGWIPASILTSP